MKTVVLTFADLKLLGPLKSVFGELIVVNVTSFIVKPTSELKNTLLFGGA